MHFETDYKQEFRKNILYKSVIWQIMKDRPSVC